jgi:hypothetical protein
MATAVVVRALKAFDDELTSVAPKRTLPTWYKGDARHKLSPSGHNPDDTPGSKAEDSDADSIPEIRAGDYRLPLNAAFTPEQFVQWLVKKCRSGEITWIKYIIFNKRIWSASTGWVTRVYKGSNPHDKHFHISCKSDTKSENSTARIGMHALLPSLPAREVKMLSITGKYPELKQGLKDPVPGVTTSYIKRAQGTLSWLAGYEGKIDGIYGPKMSEAVKTMMKGDAARSTKDGTKIAEPEWRRLLGAW